MVIRNKPSTPKGKTTTATKKTTNRKKTSVEVEQKEEVVRILRAPKKVTEPAPVQSIPPKKTGRPRRKRFTAADAPVYEYYDSLFAAIQHFSLWCEHGIVVIDAIKIKFSAVDFFVKIYRLLQHELERLLCFLMRKYFLYVRKITCSERAINRIEKQLNSTSPRKRRKVQPKPPNLSWPIPGQKGKKVITVSKPVKVEQKKRERQKKQFIEPEILCFWRYIEVYSGEIVPLIKQGKKVKRFVQKVEDTTPKQGPRRGRKKKRQVRQVQIRISSEDHLKALEDWLQSRKPIDKYLKNPSKKQFSKEVQKKQKVNGKIRKTIAKRKPGFLQSLKLHNFLDSSKRRRKVRKKLKKHGMIKHYLNSNLKLKKYRNLKKLLKLQPKLQTQNSRNTAAAQRILQIIETEIEKQHFRKYLMYSENKLADVCDEVIELIWYQKLSALGVRQQTRHFGVKQRKIVFLALQERNKLTDELDNFCKEKCPSYLCINCRTKYIYCHEINFMVLYEERYRRLFYGREMDYTDLLFEVIGPERFKPLCDIEGELAYWESMCIKCSAICIDDDDMEFIVLTENTYKNHFHNVGTIYKSIKFLIKKKHAKKFFFHAPPMTTKFLKSINSKNNNKYMLKGSKRSFLKDSRHVLKGSENRCLKDSKKNVLKDRKKNILKDTKRNVSKDANDVFKGAKKNLLNDSKINVLKDSKINILKDSKKSVSKRHVLKRKVLKNSKEKISELTSKTISKNNLSKFSKEKSSKLPNNTVVKASKDKLSEVQNKVRKTSNENSSKMSDKAVKTSKEKFSKAYNNNIVKTSKLMNHPEIPNNTIVKIPKEKYLEVSSNKVVKALNENFSKTSNKIVMIHSKGNFSNVQNKFAKGFEEKLIEVPNSKVGKASKEKISEVLNNKIVTSSKKKVIITAKEDSKSVKNVLIQGKKRKCRVP